MTDRGDLPTHAEVWAALTHPENYVACGWDPATGEEPHASWQAYAVLEMLRRRTRGTVPESEPERIGSEHRRAVALANAAADAFVAVARQMQDLAETFGRALAEDPEGGRARVRTTVDLEYLRVRGACFDQRADFEEYFGEEPVEVTAEVCWEYWDRFDFAWAALHLLTPEGWEAVQARVRETDRSMETIERLVDAGEVHGSVDWRREALSEDHSRLVRALAFADVAAEHGLVGPGGTSAHDLLLDRAIESYSTRAVR